MLMEQRLDEILKIVEERRSVTVQELMDVFDASESTIRRDLKVLHGNGKLIKVHGGAIALGSNYMTKDDDVESRQLLNAEEKERIGRYAASLIKAEDFVYLDAGTTVECMIPFIKEKAAVFVTNSITNAKKLLHYGFHTNIIGGELKAATEAIVGNEAILNLMKYNFTKGFFGTNGINSDFGFTTPDVNEAMVKKTAILRCRQGYILCDSSKFNQISPISFADFPNAQIITSKLRDDNYMGYTNIVEVDK